MKVTTLKLNEELVRDMDELVSLLNQRTGLKISRHSVMVKAVSEYVLNTLDALKDYVEG
jgi:predicted transcriptional regulator|tara:strand:+ start:1297 stop:1473 length:177 start_codon:yes stop_codon:yes gene_type:complete